MRTGVAARPVCKVFFREGVARFYKRDQKTACCEIYAIISVMYWVALVVQIQGQISLVQTWRRIMKRLARINGMVLAALLLVVSNSFAFPNIGTGMNTIEFINWENAYRLVDGEYVRVEAPGELVVGDVFVGIIRAQTISQNDVPIWDSTNTPGNIDNLSGYFVNVITDIDAVNSVITLGASSVDPFGVFTAQDILDGVVMKLYSDVTGIDAAPTVVDPATVASGIATATDGTLWASLTIDDGYWWSDAAPTFGTTGPIGQNWFGMNIVESVLGPLSKINDPLESLFDVAVDIYGVSRLNLNPNVGSNGPDGWLFASNDPATLLATPEPASMILLGSGLLGLFAARRRKTAN